MKRIKVHSPIYNNKSGILSIGLSGEEEEFSTVSIDFKTLLPFANLVKSQVRDFFFISCAVYGIDRFINRKYHSVDGWSRELQIEFPVSDMDIWNNVKENLEELLSFLTGDYWTIEFYKSTYISPEFTLAIEFQESFKQVNLFSGGLDSLIGAIDYISTHPDDKVLFTSHYDPQMKGPKRDQEYLLMLLNKQYKGQFDYIPSVKVTLSKTTTKRETTFRSRSILFIGIALIISQGKNVKDIVVPENGSVSLNYPLSPSRRTSCSTRTTHPFVLDMTNLILSKLKINSDISNPYEFNTKGEMVDSCKDIEFLRQIISFSNSCGKRGHRKTWIKRSATHCGVCMPCIYRQASLLNQIDETEYGSSINSLIPFGTKKGQDVGICLDFLRKDITKEDIKTELIVNGIKNIDKLKNYVEVVGRTRAELKNWFTKNGNSIIKNKAGF
ncbi:Qat anti-phage system QueC-like protein QatC [Flavobacterium sp. HSC-61S13]|uniref:Qat anti-phage system QueC-like protein QatC n=1 Tax=Flavobacterium sp. HSC-61S13 TaxID=2910963 RepID=UPI0020A02471|nr:Qat anti-phage system QueC-like protein QatC [Flavobacterium sp. HSC-61S13]MCP1994687.1 7-cyano-7-deazaguanine synthase in queuosine biosynthesis [Flavobacterium sp. HSC-61S13]